MQLSLACRWCNLPDWGAVRSIYVRTAAYSAIPGSTYGNIWNRKLNRFPIRLKKRLKAFGAANCNLGVILSADRGIGKFLLARILTREESPRTDFLISVIPTVLPVHTGLHFFNLVRISRLIL